MFSFFHYLPILWYRYPIPNDIREFWYNERPDILEYMQKAYQDFDIQFLPDRIIQEFNQKVLTSNLSTPSEFLKMNSTNVNNSIPTELLSTSNLVQTDIFLINLNLLTQELQNSITLYLEKLF